MYYLNLMEEYDLELDKAANYIKKENAKTVLIQLPEGLKPEATKIASYLQKNTEANILIWLDSCFGNCDYPTLKGVDLVIQWGHTDSPRPYFF